MQLLFWNHVKTDDLDDDTISMSNLLLKDPNADFDGDALNGVIIPEVAAARKYMILHAQHRILDTNSPDVGTNITLPKQAMCTANGFLRTLVPGM